LDHIREIAFKAARHAGALLRERVGNIGNIDYKSAFNIVTDVDRESEKRIIALLNEHFPNDQILAEETGAHEAGSNRRWIIDPLDGTANYSHGYPFFSVSIGFEDDGDMKLGVVYNPMSDEMFWAEKGKGAWLNDKQIHVSSHTKLGTCLLATGFPADTATAKLSNIVQFSKVTDVSMGVRRDGSAALDLAFVACGRLDGFWELKLAQWDLAAGTLLVREAGGVVTDLSGGPFDIRTGHVLATNKLIHQELIEALAFGEEIAHEDGIGSAKDVARK
jgi:myo-inositol-1(or 4)-monophosphatase